MTVSALWSSLHLGPGSLKSKHARDTVYGKRWAALSFYDSGKARWPAGAIGCPSTGVKSVDSDSTRPDLPLWPDPFPLHQVGHFPSPCHMCVFFFFNVLGNTLKSPLLCSSSSHYRTYCVTIYSFLCHFFISFSPRECKHNARVFY